MSIKYIDTLNNPNSSKKHAIIDLDDLCLDKRNPRFSSSTIIGTKREIQEEDILEYLVRFGKVNELAESINRNHGLYSEEWISCYKNQEHEIVVLEGNRRIAACKTLKDDSLIPQNVRDNIFIPSVDEKTLPNIVKIKAIVYESDKDAQSYIAAKHTKPEILKWESVEQCNYYYDQFIQGIQPNQIAYSVGESVRTVQDKIKQFGLFKKVFDVVNTEYPDVLIEDVNILPLVTKFFPPLISKDETIGLSLTFDKESLTYSPLPEKADIFNKILLKLGEAFFVRPKSHGIDPLIRESSDMYRISTDEIKSKIKVQNLIVQNIRIPGLYDLITEYKKCDLKICPEDDNGKEKGNGLSNNENQDNFDIVENSASPKKTNTNNTRTNAAKASPMKNLPEFFSEINYSRLSKKDYLGIVLVCEEIQKISSYNGGAAYKQFPISSAFLLRSLIEQVLSERLKQEKRYASMVKQLKNGSIRTPELGSIIEVFLKDFQNGNLSLFWNNGTLGKEFNKCFSGYGTKDQLDTIVHNPHLLQPDSNFLNSLSNQGLRYIIQEFLNYL